MEARQQCPECSSPRIEQTLAAYPLRLDRNAARCTECEWMGLAYETKPIPSVAILVNEIRALEAELALARCGEGGTNDE
jgi:hypothetical protein